MSDFMRPIDAVQAVIEAAGAEGATIQAIMMATGYTSVVITDCIRRLRSEGTPIHAVMGRRGIDGWETTSYSLLTGVAGPE